MLTHDQTDALEFIERYQAKNRGVAPTIREMVAGLGLRSTNNVHRLLCELELRGAICRLPNKARAIQILPFGRTFLRRAA